MFEIVHRKVWVQSREDLNFPHLASYGDDRYGLSFSRGRHAVGEWSHYLLSEDGCVTWRDDSQSPFGESRLECLSRLFPYLTLRNGTLIGVVLRRKRTGLAFIHQLTSTDQGRTWWDSLEPIQSPGVQVYIPHSPIGLFVWGPLVELPSGSLLALGYETERHTGSVILLERVRGETIWRAKSKVFAPQTDTREGVNETSIVQLPGGRIVGVCRTGYPDSPLLWTSSDDEGSTWSPPRRLPWSGVYPVLYLMDNGTLVLIHGARREDKLHGALTALGSTDGGETWSEPFMLYDGPGSCYHYGVKTGPDRLLVPYATSQFRRPELPQFTKPGDFNQIRAVTLVVKP